MYCNFDVKTNNSISMFDLKKFVKGGTIIVTAYSIIDNRIDLKRMKPEAELILFLENV